MGTLKLKRSEWQVLRNRLDELDYPDASLEFKLAVAKMKMEWDVKLKLIREQFVQNPEYLKFMEENEAINRNFAKRNGDQVSVLTVNAGDGRTAKIYDIPQEFMNDPSSAYSVAIAELKVKYADAIDKHMSNIKKYEEYLKTVESVDIHTLNEKDIPANISQKDLDIIMPFVQS